MNNKLCKNKKSGFTLAEVLITLAVIGVVASMTIPTLMQSADENQRKSQLKTAYSQISNAIRMMAIDHPNLYSEYIDQSRTFKTDFMPYFKVIQDCGWEGCPGAADYTSTYKTYNDTNQPALVIDGQFILANGSEILIKNDSFRLEIYVDVNSYNTGPNTLGVDMFGFQVMSDNTLKPMGADGTETENAGIYCDDTSNSAGNGLGCTYYAVTDQNYPTP